MVGEAKIRNLEPHRPLVERGQHQILQFEVAVVHTEDVAKVHAVKQAAKERVRELVREVRRDVDVMQQVAAYR